MKLMNRGVLKEREEGERERRGERREGGEREERGRGEGEEG